MLRRRPILSRRGLAAAVACVLAITACSDDDDSARPPADTIPPAATVMRVAVEAWPECLNPVVCDSPALREQVLQHVLPRLLELDTEGEHVPSPVLDGRPEVTLDDGDMRVTYRLASGARWSDGTPMTSSDVRATWLAWTTTPGADATGYDQIVAVDDIDPRVAVVHFDSPYADWRELFGGERGFVLRGDALGPDTDVTGAFRDQLPFSAGPYELATWGPDLGVLAANETYWHERRVAEIDQVRLVRVDEIAERDDLASFDLLVPRAGVIPEVPDGFDRYAVATASVRGVFFDRRSVLLHPLEHRQAIRHAVDRVGLLDEIYDEPPALVTCLGWLPQVGPWCDESDLPATDPDVELARFLLFTQGWLAGEGGVVFRGFERFEIPVSHDPDDPVSTAMVSEIVDSLATVGIVGVPTEVSREEWRASRDETTGIGVYDAALGVSPEVTGLYGCPPVSDVVNPLGWCDQRLNDLTAAIETTVDHDERLELVRRLGDLVAGEVAWLPLHRTYDFGLSRAEDIGVPDPMPLSAGPLGRLYDFTLD